MISHQLRPSNQPITKNHHLQTQFEGLTIKSDPQVGRQTLNKFDYPKSSVKCKMRPSARRRQTQRKHKKYLDDVIVHLYARNTPLQGIDFF